MKKLKLFFLVLTAASTVALQSCGDGDDPEPKPSISFKTGAGYTSANKNVGAGEDITLGIIATGENTLKNVKLTVSAGGSTPSPLLDSNFSSKSFNLDKVVTVGSQIGTNFTYTIQVTDNQGETSEASLTVTVVATSQVVVRTISLVGQFGTTPAVAWASTTGDVYQLADAKINSSTVDLLYYYGATNKATLSAPDNLGDLNQIWGTSNDRPETWAVKNATRFRTTSMTAAEFDAVVNNGSDMAIIDESSKAPINDNAARQVSTTQVWIFKTAAGKLGLIKANVVPTDNTSAIDFTAKYQQ